MSKRYAVVEVFATLQGEGRWAGRRAVFLRFAGCNMWNGIPADRHKGQGACAMWCDTNFAKGKAVNLDTLLADLDVAWDGAPAGHGTHDSRMVVISGGEPTLQLDAELVTELKRNGWFVAVETNGTNDVPALGLCDHVCVSPKRGSVLEVFKADELKIVLPGGIPDAPSDHHWSHGELHELGAFGEWGELFVQPQDVTDVSYVEQTYLHHIGLPGVERKHVSGADQFAANVKTCLDFLEVSPGWRLSYQVHKVLGVK